MLSCHFARFGVLLAVCALEASCSSSAASSAPGGAGTDAGTDGGPQVTCSQLKAADVQGLMTNMVAGVDVTPVGTDGDGQQCVFHDADSEQDVDIIVVPASDEAFGFAAARQQATMPVSVPGVGDEAFRSTGDVDPFAEHGGVMCTVSIAAAVQLPGAAALVDGGSLSLTDAQDAIVAAALGTVCNRIFGVGNTTLDLGAL